MRRGPEAVLRCLRSPIGEAFQLRDDLLGVFGDPRTTGKPAHDDVREGKRTLLVAYAEEAATATQRVVLQRHLGEDDLDDEGLHRVQRVLVDTGAVDRVEQRISDLVGDALDLLSVAPVRSSSRAALSDLTGTTVWRAA